MTNPAAMPKPPECPDCGAHMKLREGRYGHFYGCSQYPECKGLVSAHKDGSLKEAPVSSFLRYWRGRVYAMARALSNQRNQSFKETIYDLTREIGAPIKRATVEQLYVIWGIYYQGVGRGMLRVQYPWLKDMPLAAGELMCVHIISLSFYCHKCFVEQGGAYLARSLPKPIKSKDEQLKEDIIKHLEIPFFEG